MRPKSIVQFEYVYLALIAAGTLALYLVADDTAAVMRNNGLPVTDAFLITGRWIVSAVQVGIGLLASRRASNVARWIVVALTGLALIGFATAVPGLRGSGGLAVLAVTQGVLSVIVLWLLFRPDARAWFARGRAA